MPQHVVEPLELGESFGVAFFVSSYQRSVAAWGAAERAEAARPPTVEASRQTRESTTFGTIDQQVRIVIRELRFPGNPADVMAATGKWAYIFNRRTETCIVEAQCQEPVAGTSATVMTRSWRYRFGTITPGSMGTSASMDLQAVDAIEIQTEDADQPTDFCTFLSPVRLSRAALQHLLDRLGDAALMEPERCAFAPVYWTSTYQGVSWVCDPFAWAADTQGAFNAPAVENWVDWTTDGERSARVFVARALKSWIDAGITQITNNLSSGQPNAWIREYERLHNRLRTEAFCASAYLYHCVNGADHRAVERSLMDAGGDSWAIVCTHWSWITMGATATDPGRRYLMDMCEDADRFPSQVIFSANPPVSWTNWVADSRYAFIAARQLAFNLIPAMVEHEIAGLVRERAAWAARWARIRERVGAALERLYRDQMTWRTRAIRGELRAGAAAASAAGAADDAIAVRPGTSVIPARRARVARDFEALVASVGESIPTEYPAADLARLRTRSEALGASGERWALRLGPIIAAAEIFNMVVALQGVRDAAADERQVDIYGFRARMSTVAMIGASADASAAIAEFTCIFANRGIAAATAGGGEASLSLVRTAAGAKLIGGPLAMVSGTTEMLAHGQAMIDAGWGRGNTAQAVASGTAAIGGALTAVSGGLMLAGYFLGASSSLGPIGVVVGIIGAVLILAGAFIAHMLSRDPYEEFAQFSFLGPGAEDDVGYGFPWSPSGLPAHTATDQVYVLMHILAAFQIRRLGTGSFTQFATTAPTGISAQIQLAATGDNPVLDIEVVMRSSGHDYLCRMRFRGHQAEMEYFRDVTTLVLDPEGSAPTRDDEGRLTGYRLNLRPRWIIHPGSPAIEPSGTWLGALEHVHVRVRLDLGGRVTAPRHLDACQFDVMDASDGDAANSLDPSTYVTMAW